MHLRLGEVHVVGGDQGQGQFVGEVEQRRLDGALDVQAVAVQFHGEPVGEGFPQRGEKGGRGVAATFGKQAGHGAERAAGEQEQAGRVLLQGFEPHAGAAGRVGTEEAPR